MEVTVAPDAASYRCDVDGDEEDAMRLPHSFSSGSRNPERTSKETEAVLVVACAMIAILVAILNADATTVVGFLP
jgi:hypothetical protein